MIDPADIAHKICSALLAARERVLAEAVTTAELIAQSRGAIADHIAVEFEKEHGSDILTVRTVPRTPHGARIVAELEKSGIELPHRSLH